MSQEKFLLVVDDDRELGALIADFLMRAGYRVSVASDGPQMLARLERTRIDLVVLDVNLPGEDGISLCARLRRPGGPHATLPVLMLTARNDSIDRIVGLETGADDYLAKPFVPRELQARIAALLRRTSTRPCAPDPDELRTIGFRGYRVDGVRREVHDPSGRRVPLSCGEYRLLGVFLRNPGRLLTREHLSDVLTGREAGPFDRAVDMVVSRLRMRLRPAGSLIETVRGKGYLFAADVLTP